ncbi:MAG: DUF5330 domain-containing protein [Rhizobiaceae bacterium]
MFLLRSAFWLSLVVAIIPVNPQDLESGQRPVSTMETVGALQALVSDLAQFCERNARSCETGAQIASQMKVKARTGLQFASAWLEGSDTQVASPAGSVEQIVTGSTVSSN